VGVSIGDTLAALHGVIGILLALQERQRSGLGQVIDVALYEAVFNCMESLLPEYSAFGAVREPAGSALPGIAPSNAYRCSDGGYALIAGNGDSIFRRLMGTIGRPDLANDPQLSNNAGRVARVSEIDAAIGQWSAARSVDEVLAALDAQGVPAGRIYTVADIAADPPSRYALGVECSVDEVLAALDAQGVPAGRIYTVADIAADPHYRAREMIVPSQVNGQEMLLPGIVPKLSRTPGAHVRPAPRVGQDSRAVLRGMGLDEAQIAELEAMGVVASPELETA